MQVMLFILVLVASFIIVRIGAIVFQMTGLEWSLAKFQSLSCFSGTGFTTKEAELITGNRQRRRIASILMVLGNAGLVTMIASVASALDPDVGAWWRGLSESYLPFYVASFLVPWINLFIIVGAVYVVYKLFTNKKITKKLTDNLRRRIIKTEIFKPVSIEELLLVSGGYGVSKIAVTADSPLVEKTLAESGLRKQDITVLAVVRDETTMPNPSANTKILAGDELLSFARLENVRKHYGPDRGKKA